MKLAPVTIKCPACSEPIQVPVSYRGEGVTTQDDGSAVATVAIEVDPVAIEAHVAKHAA